MKIITALGIALLPLMGTMTSYGGPTDEYSRAGKWDAYAFGQYGKITLVDASVYQAGLGLGYNMYNQLNLNAEFGGGGVGWLIRA